MIVFTKFDKVAQQVSPRSLSRGKRDDVATQHRHWKDGLGRGDRCMPGV
jgi:hypothetical protein